MWFQEGKLEGKEKIGSPFTVAYLALLYFTPLYLVRTNATRGVVLTIFPATFQVYRSAIYTQGLTSKYALGGRLTVYSFQVVYVVVSQITAFHQSQNQEN